jgi:glycosyltransferase involved in cell wall biosynthesis
MQKFSVIIPAYNESNSIISTIDEIKRLPNELEIIVVDDGSTDNTGELASATGVLVVTHTQNMGYGASLKTGIHNASHEYIFITDADRTYPNTRIPELFDTMINENLDMVVGARTNKNAAIPTIRKPAKWFINRLASFLVGYKIPDINSGLRVMRKDILLKYLHLMPDGFSFTSTITLVMLTNRLKVKYVGIDYFKRDGQSKIRPIRDTLNFIQLIIRMVLYFDPLKNILPVSLRLIFSGVLLIIFEAVA